MNLRLATVFALALVLGPATSQAQDKAPAKGGGKVHVVSMVEKGQYGIAFDPMRTTAAPGDTIRFVQKGALPHNVLFKSGPEGAKVSGLESPMLTASGSTWDLVLDSRFVPGKYHYVCVPHETMGMAGLLYVQ